MQDDPIVNASSFYVPEIPLETQKANEEEARRAAEALPFIEDVIKWFDLAIANTDSIAAAKEEARRLQKSFEATSDAYDIVRVLLEQKRNELQSLALTFDV